MSRLTLTRVIAIAIAGSFIASATTAGWAKPHEEPRGFKTYLPGEGGCKDDMTFWTAPCG